MNQDNDKFDNTDSSQKNAVKFWLGVITFPLSLPWIIKAAKIGEPKKKPKPKPKMTWKQLRIFLLTTSIILAGMTACLFHFPWTS